MFRQHAATSTRSRLLDPIDRFSEILFGLIMVLTFTGSISAGESAREAIRTMLFASIGCNLAWVIVGVLREPELEAMRHRLNELAEIPERARPTRDDVRCAIAVMLLVFLSTFPVVIPFIIMNDAIRALRVSNGIAIAMLFVIGFWLGRYMGGHPWRMAFSMVLVGVGLVSITIALGG
jgi:hypothetical protein